MQFTEIALGGTRGYVQEICGFITVNRSPFQQVLQLLDTGEPCPAALRDSRVLGLGHRAIARRMVIRNPPSRSRNVGLILSRYRAAQVCGQSVRLHKAVAPQVQVRFPGAGRVSSGEPGPPVFQSVIVLDNLDALDPAVHRVEQEIQVHACSFPQGFLIQPVSNLGESFHPPGERTVFNGEPETANDDLP